MKNDFNFLLSNVYYYRFGIHLQEIFESSKACNPKLIPLWISRQMHIFGLPFFEV